MNRKAAALILSLVPFFLNAEEWSGESTCMEVVPSASVLLGADDMSVQASLFFRVKWKAWTLMGEPVVDSSVAWTINNVSITQAPFLKLKKDIPAVPKEIASKIRLIDAAFLGKTSFVRSPLIRFDPGVLSAPYLSGYGKLGGEGDGVYLKDGSFSRLAAKEKERWFSFNVPGSPDWGKLFWVETGRETWKISGAYAPAEAKEFMRRGFSPLYAIKLESATLDLSAVRNWLQDLENKEIAALKAATDKRSDELAVKEEKRKKAESADFWGTPASVFTIEDEKERAEIPKTRAVIRDAEAALAAGTEKTKKLRLAFDDRIAALTAELKSRPKPGEGPKYPLKVFREKDLCGVKDASDRILIPAVYGAIKLPEGPGLVAAYDMATKRYGYVDLAGRIVLPFQYYDADEFSQGLASVQVKAGHGPLEYCTSGNDFNTDAYIDEKGTIVIPGPFWVAVPFREDGTASVTVIVGIGPVQKEKRDSGGYYVKRTYTTNTYMIDKSGNRVGPIETESDWFGEPVEY